MTIDYSVPLGYIEGSDLYRMGISVWVHREATMTSIPVYGHPRKTWQALTAKEKGEIAQQADVEDWHDYEVMDATEAKLKEKNHE